MACFGGFLPYFLGKYAKKVRHIGKNEDAILWRVRSKVFWEILVLVKHYKECSLSKPVRAAVLAHILSDPRLPAGPPNAVTRSRRKYHSVVARTDYSVFKVPPAYQKPDAGTEGCSPSPRAPSSWTAALALLNIHCRMHPALGSMVLL